ncbi:hypothetical protein PENSPDRAFT_756904 [Peniophora sp. CONT]|nr:hypothetical protein PENSPDRAFT_756904 [Peniophora sp. CONT]
MPGRKRATISPAPALRTSKRQRVAPNRTPQVITPANLPTQQRKATKAVKRHKPTPEEIAEEERVQLVSALTDAKDVLAAKRTELCGPPRRDAELYLLDSCTYGAQGEGPPVELSSDDMIVCKAENTLFRLPRSALIDVAQLFADMFAIPFPPGEDVDGKSDERPIVLHGLTAQGFRQAMINRLHGEGNAAGTPPEILQLLVFAHRTGAYDLYEQAAMLFANHFVSPIPPWAHDTTSSVECHKRHRPRDYDLNCFSRPQCYDREHCIKQLPSYSHPDDKKDGDGSSTVASAFYRCPDDDSDELTWGWYNDHFDGPSQSVGPILSMPTAIELLDTALALGIDEAFFPGALAALFTVKGALTPMAVAQLTCQDEGSPLTIAELVAPQQDELQRDSFKEPDSVKGQTGKGTQLVRRLRRAERLWAYCNRVKGEATWGMLNTVIRTVWDAPNENTEGWVFMCEKP